MEHPTNSLLLAAYSSTHRKVQTIIGKRDALRAPGTRAVFPQDGVGHLTGIGA